MGKELEVYRDRAAAELDKDLARAYGIKPFRGIVQREDHFFGVQVYLLQRAGEKPVVHVTREISPESPLISRFHITTTEEIRENVPGVKFPDFLNQS